VLFERSVLDPSTMFDQLGLAATTEERTLLAEHAYDRTAFSFPQGR